MGLNLVRNLIKIVWFDSSNNTYDNTVSWVPANNLLDLLSGALSGGNGAVGITVGVVQVQDIYRDVCPQAGLTQHRGSIPEVTCEKTSLRCREERS